MWIIAHQNARRMSKVRARLSGKLQSNAGPRTIGTPGAQASLPDYLFKTCSFSARLCFGVLPSVIFAELLATDQVLMLSTRWNPLMVFLLILRWK